MSAKHLAAAKSSVMASSRNRSRNDDGHLKPVASSERRVIAALFTEPTGLGLLFLTSVLPLIIGASALLYSGRVLSREMTWDLLFNLAGAWHLSWGHVAHIDFREPVGALNFLLTALGFRLVGYSPFAFVVGAVIVALVLFIAASLAAWRRLPLLPATIFVILTVLLALVPVNVGDVPRAYSFAMSYNRYGWAALAVLFLILFLPPKVSRVGTAVDVAVVGVLVAAMFYLKITYFVAALAAICFAIPIWPHLRSCWLAWAIVAGLLIANALLPYSHPYLADLWQAVTAGGVRSSATLHLHSFFAHIAEYAAYGAAFAIAIWLSRRDPAMRLLPHAIAFIVTASLLVLSQNNQTHDIPAALIISFIGCAELGKRWWLRDRYLLIAALMAFPLFSIGGYAASLAGYASKVRAEAGVYIVESTRLQGLVVPAEPGNLLAAFSSASGDHRLLSRARSVGARFDLTAFEYVETLMEAAKLFGGGTSQLSPGIVLLDQINPLPFMLGIRPPRGGNLWSGIDAPLRPADELFGDVDYVLIPKFPTNSIWTDAAVAVYDPFIAVHFPHRKEAQSWILKSRVPF